MSEIKLQDGKMFDPDTWVMTLNSWEEIQTEPVSQAAQEGAEEYMKILESKK